MSTQKYIVKRTGRRCTRYRVQMSDGSYRILNATGSHVWDMTEADAAMVGALKDTQVRKVKPKAPPKPKAAAPAPAKPKKKKKK